MQHTFESKDDLIILEEFIVELQARKDEAKASIKVDYISDEETEFGNTRSSLGRKKVPSYYNTPGTLKTIERQRSYSQRESADITR